MRILVVVDKAELEEVRQYVTKEFGLLGKAEYVFATERSWRHLTDLNPSHGQIDAVVVTTLSLHDREYDVEGLFGLVYAAEAGKQNLPCVVTIEGEGPDKVWLYHLAQAVGGDTITKREGFPYQMMIKLCEVFRQKGIDWH
jgi:hypothetical protein